MFKKWYGLNVSSGSEKKIKSEIINSIASTPFVDLIEEIFIPVVKTEKIKNGKQFILEKAVMPGYLLIKMDFHDGLRKVITNIPKVVGFLGGNNPISDAEIEQMKQKSNIDVITPDDTYEIGEIVKIIEGPFFSFSGVIENIDTQKLKLKVSILIFGGRATKVDLSFNQVEKG